MDRHIEPRAIGRPMPDRNKSLFAISNGISGLSVETPLAIEINGVPVGTLVCTHESLEELVVGWSYSHGFLESRADVDRFRVQSNRASLMLRRSLPGGHDWRELLNAGFDGGSVVRAPSPTGATPPPRDEFVLDARFVLALAAELFQRFTTQPDDRGLRHVGASDGQAVMVGARDISRHNAFDKLVGWSLLSETPLRDLIILVDGEISAATAYKAIRGGARVLIGIDKPTAQAVRLAQSAGLTLIGRAMETDRTIFTHPWRIDRAAK